jgi:Cu/Ag efflux protein CusF
MGFAEGGFAAAGAATGKGANMQRKPSLAAVTVAVLIGACVVPVAAQQASAPAPKMAEGAVGGTKVSVTGEVVAVDAATRAISIKGPDGNVREYTVDPKVRNLEQVKVGDKIQLDYRVGLALALMKGGDSIREKVESEATKRAAPGAKPGGEVTRTTTVVANVEKVDKKRKIATLKGPQGNVMDVQVQDPKVLEEIKAGDQVVARVTESVAISVHAPTAAKPAASK